MAHCVLSCVVSETDGKPSGIIYPGSVYSFSLDGVDESFMSIMAKAIMEASKDGWAFSIDGIRVKVESVKVTHSYTHTQITYEQNSLDTDI